MKLTYLITLYHDKTMVKRQVLKTTDINVNIEHPDNVLDLIKEVQSQPNFYKWSPDLGIQLAHGDPDLAEQWRSAIVIGGR